MWMLLTALAAEPPTCPPADELVGAERWLRAASLDLRGVIPTLEEYQQISSPDELPDALIEEWLDSEEFIERAVRQHRTRLWNRFDNTIFIATRNRMSLVSNSYLAVRNRNTTYRGSNLTCGDFPATDSDGDGEWDLNADGQEGWILVHPYWEPDPNTQVAVCAFDGNDAEFSPTGNDCSTPAGASDPGCGCGPQLNYCVDNSVHTDIRDGFGAAMDHRIAEVLRSQRPYTDLFTEDRIYLNGPLAHFYRDLSQVPSGVRFNIPPFDLDLVPDLPYSEKDTWVAVPTHPAHAGIFTDPAFLVRFMTNRARTNRFYEDFLCQPLVAPANGIDLDAPNTLDLANRAGCSYCHALMEPTGVYWGRFTESGGGFLDPDTYPAFDSLCYQCSEDSSPCPTYCSQRYIVDPNSDELDPYVGQLQALQFRPDSEHDRIDQGPGALVQTHIATGRISQCLTEKTSSWLLGRELTDADDPIRDAFDAELLASGWSYRQLVKSIITSETYRRVR